MFVFNKDIQGALQSSFGAEIGVPLRWGSKDSGGWVIDFEPFYSRLVVSQGQDLYGARLRFGLTF